MKRRERKDYRYGKLLCLLAEGLSTDSLTPPPPRPPSPIPVSPAKTACVPQSSRTMGSLVLEGSRGMGRERGASGSLILTRR